MLTWSSTDIGVIVILLPRTKRHLIVAVVLGLLAAPCMASFMSGGTLDEQMWALRLLAIMFWMAVLSTLFMASALTLAGLVRMWRL